MQQRLKLSIFHSLLDLVFPPICVYCGDYTDLKFLCENCWQQSELLDLSGRCKHCFEEIEGGTLCPKCARAPLLPFERAAVFDKRSPICKILNEDNIMATASFAYYQWLKLDWKEPDLIVSIPPSRSGVAKEFASLCSQPCPNLFRRVAWPVGTERWEILDHLIEENSIILLFDDGCSLKELQMATAALSTTFPKKVYLISLYA